MVRRVLDGSDEHADVVGPLVSWHGSTLTVGNGDGSTVDIEASSVVACKPVPAAPRFRGQVATPAETDDLDLERVAQLGWRALHAEWVDGWLLRDGQGFTGRSNSALPLGPGPGLGAVVDWYRVRGLTPQIQVPLPARADLDAELEAAGWEAHSASWVMTASTAEVAEQRSEPVRIDEAPDDEWLARYHYRGGELPVAGRTILRAAQKVGFASIRGLDGRGGQVQAIARGACDQGWVGLTAIEVDAEQRRKGLGRQIVTGVCEWAERQGAANVYLQVMQTNEPAVALYESLGFTRHHSYQYRRLND